MPACGIRQPVLGVDSGEVAAWRTAAPGSTALNALSLESMD